MDPQHPLHCGEKSSGVPAFEHRKSQRQGCVKNMLKIVLSLKVCFSGRQRFTRYLGSGIKVIWDLGRRALMPTSQYGLLLKTVSNTGSNLLSWTRRFLYFLRDIIRTKKLVKGKYYQRKRFERVFSGSCCLSAAIQTQTNLQQEIITAWARHLWSSKNCWSSGSGNQVCRK